MHHLDILAIAMTLFVLSLAFFVRTLMVVLGLKRRQATTLAEHQRDTRDVIEAIHREHHKEVERLQRKAELALGNLRNPRCSPQENAR